jgi:hypothetical protein
MGLVKASSRTAIWGLAFIKAQNAFETAYYRPRRQGRRHPASQLEQDPIESNP